MRKSRFWPIDERLAHWHPVLPERDLGSKPAELLVCGVPIVLYRAAGKIHALYNRCAHRRAPLSKGRIEGDTLVCAYHGCSFAGDGAGYCPTTKSHRFSVPRFEVQQNFGTIWLRSPDAVEWTDAQTEIVPALFDEDQNFAGLISKTIAAPLQLVVDNMTELEHTGEVHRSLAFGADEYDTIETTSSVQGDQVHIFYSGQQRKLPIHLRALTGLKSGDFYVQTATVGFQPPHAVYDINWHEGSANGPQRDFALRFVIYYTPIDSRNTRLYAFVFWQHKAGLPTAAMHLSAPVLRAVVSQELERDKRIIEAMPLDEASIDMFQLNKFDRPLVMTRKAMLRLYPWEGQDVPRNVVEAAE
ncbi:MAG: Rieske 2Fe-2S domain-containing protein [Paracoccaceae bacterium]|nr:Rieske 2Fe-2S domain-containing protein [Paracoccaceae bacterium]